VNVIFVLPQAVPVGSASHVQFRSPTDLFTKGFGQNPPTEDLLKSAIRPDEKMQVRRLAALLQPYGNPQSYEQMIKDLIAHPEILRSLLPQMAASFTGHGQTASGIPIGPVGGSAGVYQGDLMGQVRRYAALAVEMARGESFEVVHAHDWMTYPAGLAVASATGKPLVVHVHSTEFDRSGDNIWQEVYDIERAGMHGASKVICVSHYTRNIVINRYGVPSEKVEVVYNAVELPNGSNNWMTPIRHDEKLVLFLGRVTMQKGPEYFLQAAKKVVEKIKNVRFVMAGSGDMIAQCIRLAANLKLGRYVTFTGFLRGDDVAKVFRMADLYVMPSVSEPFGIAPLEAMSHNVPVIISKTSGVSEVLTHALKVDFWDVDEMANKILAVLRHPPLQRTLRQHGQIELKKLSWRDSAARVADIYGNVSLPRDLAAAEI